MKLIDEINTTRVAPGACAFWWLGQHSFVLKLGDKVLYLDPYLSECAARKVAPLLKPGEITNATLIFGSHDHEDHIDRPVWPALAQASPLARFVVPRLLVERLARELGIDRDRFIGLDHRTETTIGGIRIRGVAAAHETLDRDPATGWYPYLGFLIEANGCRVYHSGDTCPHEDLLPCLRDFAPDIVFLPINGRDAERFSRGCMGNLTVQEAADLAGALNPRVAIPAHFDMFDGNTEDPQRFARAMAGKYPSVRVVIPQHGITTMVAPGVTQSQSQINVKRRTP